MYESISCRSIEEGHIHMYDQKSYRNISEHQTTCMNQHRTRALRKVIYRCMNKKSYRNIVQKLGDNEKRIMPQADIEEVKPPFEYG